MDGRIATLKGAYPDFYDNIAHCLRELSQGRPAKPAVAAEEALSTALIIEAAYASVSEKRVITITES